MKTQLGLLTLITFLGIITPINLSWVVPISNSQVLAQSVEDKKAEADRLYEQGKQQYNTSQFQEALQSYQQALKIYQSINDPNGEAKSLNNLGNVYFDLGEYEKARFFSEQSLAIFRKIGDLAGEASSLDNLGNIYSDLGEYEKAISFHEQSLAIFRKIGDLAGEASPLNNLGLVYYDLGEYEKAISFYEQSLAIFRKIGDLAGEASSLHNLGLVYNSLGEYEKAISFYEQSLGIFRKIDNLAGEASSLRSLGLVYYSLEEYEKAKSFSEQSLAIDRKIGYLAGESKSLGNLGNVYFDLGEYKKARSFYEQSLAIDRKIGDLAGESKSLNELGIVYYSLGEYEKAKSLYEQSLAIFRKIGDLAEEARSLRNLGRVYNSLEESEKAISFYEQSLAIVRKIGDLAGESKSLNDLGTVYNSLGEYEKARSFFEQSLAIFKKIGDLDGESSSLLNLGNVYSDLREYEKAISFYEQSLAIARKIGDLDGESSSLHNFGNVYYLLGEYKKAISFYEQSLAIFRKIGNLDGESASLGNLGLVYYDLGEYEKAISFSEQSLAIAKKIGDLDGKASSLNNLGLALKKLKRLPEAEQNLLASIEIKEKIRQNAGSDSNKISLFDTQRNSYITLQQVLIAQNKINQALEISERGRARAFVELLFSKINNNSDPSTTIKPPNFEQIKQIAKQQNYTIVEYAIMYDEFDINGKKEWRESEIYIYVIKPNGEIHFRKSDLTKLHEQNTNLWQLTNNSSSTIPSISNPSSSVNTNPEIDSQNNQLIKNPTIIILIVISGVSLIGLTIYLIKAPLIKNVWGDLNKIKTIKVSHLLLPSILLTTCVISSSILYLAFTQQPNFTGNNNNNFLANYINFNRSSIVAQNDNNLINNLLRGLGIYLKEGAINPTDNLQELHQILIKPIEDLLPNNPEEKVIFIPHESLFLVPFPALKDNNGQYLIEKHTILTAPSIQTLQLTREQKEKLSQKSLFSNGNKGDKALIVGNPTMPIVPPFPGETPQQLISLPGAEKEAKDIAKILNTQPILGNKATKSNILKQMQNAPIIHLATHGLLDEYRGLGSSIALAPDANYQPEIGEVNGLLTAAEILDLKLKADLVVLSACDTGKGKITGDGVVGLSRSLISAGVPSVLVSLWSVPDAPTGELMTEFYRQWEQTGDKAQALRQAMLITLKKHPDPVDWAAFTLIGESD